jgi:anaerobic selenocysteine-containing dehydrogenase
MPTEEIHTYCPMCIAQCGVVAIVENGKFTKVRPDSGHPNGGICIKGSAAPELVYAPDRLKYPMKRTRRKGDADPGWVEISWEEALDTVTSRLLQIKAQSGPEAVVFACATPSGSSFCDFYSWMNRFGHAFGSPNRLSAIHICTWNVMLGSKHTFGTPTPPPDFENTRCILLWGANPRATYPTFAQRINRARARSAKLIVIDPRKHNLARDADHWLQVRPGADAALALAMIHVLIEENLYDEAFVRDWTNGPFLVRDDTQQLLTARELAAARSATSFVVWDTTRNAPVEYDPDRGYAESDVKPALLGSFSCRLARGALVTCRPAFAILAERAAQYAPEQSERITWVVADAVRNAARLFAGERPSCYHSWAGLEMHSNAMQLNRAVNCFYALTGQYDQSGSNVLTATTPIRPVDGPQLLPKEKAAIRLGLKEHPLGPPNEPGHVQAASVYDAILTGQPYKVRAMVCFGSDPLLGHGDPARGKEALSALDFYVHMDFFANPSAMFADLLLPASTSWETESIKTNFAFPKGASAQASRWVQMRKPVVPPLYGTRSDLAVIFDLACRLGLGQHFFDGDTEAGWRHLLEPSGITLEDLRAHPVGVEAKVATHHRKYAAIDPQTGRPRGFATPSRKLELYSIRFAGAGYDPLPRHDEPAESPIRSPEGNRDYPLILTSFRHIQFVSDEHRNAPRLRKEVPDPLIEIHPRTATDLSVDDGDWVNVETASGKVRLKAKYSDSLHPNVVCAPYGWWQGCAPLSLPAYDALSPAGANINLVIANKKIDPISASVPHRSSMCRISKAVA